MKRSMKWLTRAAALVLSAGLLASCSNPSGAKENKKNITIWASGSDNVRVQFQKQVEKFNELNEGKYTAKLEFIVSGTGVQGLRDKVIAAQKANQKNTDFDVIEIGEDEVPRYISEGGEDIFVKLDESKIPNLSKLQFKPSANADRIVPYRGTTVVLAFNRETVPEPPKTTAELYDWIRNNPGRFAYNTPDSGGAGGSFVVTSIYNFLAAEALTSSDEAYKAQWDQGFELLKDLHPHLYKSSGRVVYPNKNQGTLDLLANKEIDMAPAWADMLISQKQAGTMPESVSLTQLDPPFTGSTVVFGVPTIGSNVEGAHAWINYMLSPEAQNIALESMAAIPVISYDELDGELTKLISDLKIERFRLSSLGQLSTDLNERWAADIGTLP